MAENLGLCPLFGDESWVPIKHNVAWTEAHLHAKCHLDPSSRLSTKDMGQNWGLCPFRGRGAGFPSNTMWLGPTPTCMPSFILIHLTVWPQYTNVTDRQIGRHTGQDKIGQRSDSIRFTNGRPKTVLFVIQNKKKIY